MQQLINIGTLPRDGTGDPLRTAFDKCNKNFTELYAAGVSPPPSQAPVGGNPTAKISGTLVNGMATTFMRSDAAPPLANTSVVPGSYTSANITVDAQGRLTAAANGSAMALPPTGVLPGSYLNANITVDSTGRIISAASGSAPPAGAAPGNPTAQVSGAAVNGTAATFMRSDAAPPLANTAVIAGSYNNANITVDQQGRLTAATSGTPPGYVTPQQFGAKADGVTDDSGAFQAAHNSLGSLGGMVLIPSGQYSIQHTINVTNPVRFVGAAHGYNGPYLYAGTAAVPADITVFNLTQSSTLEHMTIFGCGKPGTNAGPFPATQPVIVNSAGWCRLDDVFTQGGSHGFYQAGPAGECLVFHSTFTACYGSSAVYQANSGSMFIRSNTDQAWPVSQPPLGTAPFSAWTASTAVAVGAVVSSGGFYIQCRVAGTTGTVAPALKNYSVDIPDGTAIWRLVCPVTYYGMQFDSGVPVSQVIMGDFGTPGTASIGFTNTTTGGPPNSVQILQSVIAGGLHGIYIGSGFSIDITDCFPAAPVQAGGAAIFIDTGCQGDVHIHGGQITACSYGVWVGGGVNVMVDGVRIAGATIDGIIVESGVSQFCIQGNTFAAGPDGSNANYAVQIGVGASDHYIVHANLVGTLTVTDGGTGTHKLVSGNV